MIKGEGKNIALVSGSLHLSYKELRQNVTKYSSLYNEIIGKHVALFSENRIEWIYAFYSVWMNKGIPVPIDFMSGADDVAYILNDCMPEVVFTSKDKHATLEKAMLQVAHKPRVIILDEVELQNIDSPSAYKLESKPDQTAVIIYTSGTTGSPKGVMLSFENIVANINAVTKDVRIILPSDNLMILLPLHHIFPLLGTLIVPFYLGATAAICPSLNADDILKTLKKNKISILIGVPRLYSLIRKGIVDKINQTKAGRILFNLSKRLKSKAFAKLIFKEIHNKFGGHVRHIVSGGAALDPDVAIDFIAMGFDMLEGYGMTEAAPMIAFTRPNTFKPGSAGQIVPGVKVEIRDGEIVASGKNIMQGYYNRPEETSDIIKSGWLYTGDLGRVDKKGFLYITGRRKEIIVLSNGKNINPSEIENKLEKSSELIKESGVFLYKDKLCAFLVPDVSKIPLGEKVEEYLKKQLIAPYNENASVSKRILKVFVTKEELPRTRLSKLQRFKLSEYAEQLAKPKKEINEVGGQEDLKELETIMGFIETQVGEKVSPNDNLHTDLALDSLSKITLLVYLENTFGVNIKEEEYGNFGTLKELAIYIKDKKTRMSPEKVNWKEILKEKINFNLPKVGFSFNLFNWSYRAIFRSLFRIQAEGSKNIPEGPCILAPNHQSFIDGFVIASLLRRKVMKRTYIYAKDKHWSKWWQKILARKNNIILMDLNKDLKLSIQKMAEVLKKGKNLIIFPEGTRSEDGSIGEFKKTFAILARELNVPVIPVAIRGAHQAMPVGSKFPRLFKKVSVKFLNPVYPAADTYETLIEKVKSTVSKHL